MFVNFFGLTIVRAGGLHPIASKFHRQQKNWRIKRIEIHVCWSVSICIGFLFYLSHIRDLVDISLIWFFLRGSHPRNNLSFSLIYRVVVYRFPTSLKMLLNTCQCDQTPINDDEIVLMPPNISIPIGFLWS